MTTENNQPKPEQNESIEAAEAIEEAKTLTTEPHQEEAAQTRSTTSQTERQNSNILKQWFRKIDKKNVMIAIVFLLIGSGITAGILRNSHRGDSHRFQTSDIRRSQAGASRSTNRFNHEEAGPDRKFQDSAGDNDQKVKDRNQLEDKSDTQKRGQRDSSKNTKETEETNDSNNKTKQESSENSN